MITLSLQQAGKRFNREWIFRNLSYSFQQGESYAITGANGSGKSTLLQILSGSMQVSEGDFAYTGNNTSVDNENIYKQIAITAPYLDVVEEMTAQEFLRFHDVFKPLTKNLSVAEILNIVELKYAANKQIRFYSSGMKQRVKLAQAIFADVPVLLLDEPCTNFDEAGYQLYHHLIKTYCFDKLVIISSNDINEYNFCNKRLNMADYKQLKIGV